MIQLEQSVRVAGREIPPQAIAAEMQHHPAESAADAWQAAARALAVREVLRQACLDRGLLKPDDDAEGEEQAIALLLAQNIRTPEPEDADCRRYYEANPQRFHTPDQLRVRHILLPAAKDDFTGREQARKKAARMLRELEQAPQAFADLAARYSACPSGSQGGDLGWIGKGATVPEFERQVARLEPGAGPMAIETRYGIHVVEVVEKVPGTLRPYEDVQAWIAGYLRQQSHHRAVHQFIQLLMAQYRVEGLDLTLPDNPLVQ